ncbi:MAG: hypothetical protein WA364_09900 [Candidatus Nitrosopolaris sp.]
MINKTAIVTRNSNSVEKAWADSVIKTIAVGTGPYRDLFFHLPKALLHSQIIVDSDITS